MHLREVEWVVVDCIHLSQDWDHWGLLGTW